MHIYLVKISSKEKINNNYKYIIPFSEEGESHSPYSLSTRLFSLSEK